MPPPQQEVISRMRLSLIIKLTRIFIIASVLLPATALSQTNSKERTATVSGRVTIKDKPAPGVAVGLRRMQTSGYEITARALTDNEGKYVMTQVPAGSYEAMVTAPAFVQAGQNQSRGRAIVLTEGENIEDINFALVRGGVVTGKILDADGRPVIQQQVGLFRADAWEQAKTQNQPIFPMAGASTDDRGIYRIFGVYAGRYKLAVGRADDTYASSFAARASFRRVFHPNVSDPAKATVIEVTEGSEATGIDITLEPPIPTYTISGRIVYAEKEQPAPRISIGLQRISNERFPNFTNFVVSNDRGEFVADGVAPGKYTFAMTSEREAEFFLESLQFDVTDQNVTGLVLKLSPGASVSGVVILENESPIALRKLANAAVNIFVENAPSRGRSSNSPVARDGTFRVGGLPAGRMHFGISGGMNGDFIREFMITRVDRNGVNQESRTLEIGDREQITGIQIFLRHGDATLRGVINVENGKLPPDARFSVSLVPVGQKPLDIGYTQVDSRGHFIIEQVPGGIYDVTVNVVTPDRKRRPSAKQQVNVAAGTTTNVTILFDASEPKSP